MKVSLITS